MPSMSRYFVQYKINEKIAVRFPNGETENYTIGGTLGEGGSSVVYLAKDSNGAERRIKTFNPINAGYTMEGLETVYRKYSISSESRDKCVPIDKTNMLKGELIDYNYEELKQFNEVFIFDPMNDITLSKFYQIYDTKDTHRLINITKNILSFTRILRGQAQTHAIHFDIKPENILINQLTGSFIGFIDYNSSFVFNDDINGSFEKYNSFNPDISSKLFDSNTAKELYFVYDIYCVMKPFVEEITKHEVFDASAIKRTLDFIKRIENNDFKQFDKAESDPEKKLKIVLEKAEEIYIMLQDELSAVNTAGWSRIKHFCSGSEDSEDCSVGNILCGGILKNNSPFEIDTFCLFGKKPAIIKCNYYEERKVICNELAKRIRAFSEPGKNKTMIAAPITINITTKTDLDIQSAIASEITEDGLFSTVCNTISSFNPGVVNKLILVINIRTYSGDTIKNLKKQMDLLRQKAKTLLPDSPFELFNYIIIAGDIYEQKENSADFSEDPLDLGKVFETEEIYNYDFYKVKEILDKSRPKDGAAAKLWDAVKIAEANKALKRLGSIYQIRKYSSRIINNTASDNKKGNNAVSMSAFDSVTDALDELSNEKAIAFVRVVYRAFATFSFEELKPGIKRIIARSTDYHSPLEEKDIVLVAERTGIINILGRGKPDGTLYIEVGNPVLLKEFLACAVYERYSAMNSEQYTKIFYDSPLDEETCKTICDYLKNDNYANEKFEEVLKNDDPIRQEWNEGNPKNQNVFSKTKLDPTATYTAINLRLIKMGLVGKNQYEEPAKETGHAVKLNPEAKRRYKNNDALFEIIDRIEKKSNKFKWHVLQLVVIISLIIALVAIIGVVYSYSQNAPTTLEYDIFSPTRILRQTTENNTAIPFNEDYLVYETDKISIPVLSSSKPTSVDYLRGFQFVANNGKKYSADLYYYSSEGKWVKWTQTSGASFYNMIDGSANLIIGFPESELQDIYDPIHITSIVNSIDGEKRACDFWVISRKNAVQVSLEQLPGTVSHSMECIVTFSSEHHPFNISTNKTDYFLANDDGAVEKYAESVSLLSETGTEKKLLLRFEDLNETDDPNSEKMLGLFFSSKAASIKYNALDLYGVGNISYSYTNDLLCAFSEKVKLLNSSKAITADVIKPEYQYHTESAKNAKNIVIEPDKNSNLTYEYCVNTESVKNVNTNIENAHLLLESYIGFFNYKNDIDNESYFEFDAEMVNKNGQIGLTHISADLKREDAIDSIGPTISLLYVQKSIDEITIALEETDDFPLAHVNDTFLDSASLPAEVIRIFGAKYGKISHNTKYMSDKDGKAITRKQIITFTIEIEEYYGSEDDVSILIDTSIFKDSAENVCVSGNILIGEEFYFSAPYRDNDNSICVDVTRPYFSIDNMSEHILNHDMSGRTTIEIIEKSEYDTTVRFSGINDFREAAFVIKHGAYILNSGKMSKETEYNFGAGLKVIYCTYFSDKLQIAIQMPIDDNCTIDAALLSLLDENGDNISYGIIENARRIGNMQIYTVTGVKSIPETVVLGEGHITNNADSSYISGEYEAQVSVGTLKLESGTL